jgi:two-component system OmpR family response regulator
VSAARVEMDDPGRLRVLCVDDCADIADSAALLLRLVGFESRASYSGLEALAVARDFLPAVYLIDLNMPGMDGDELAIRLLNMPELHPLLLVAVTAMNSSEARRRIETAGFHLHMVKPVDPYKLIEVVDAFFRMNFADSPDKSRHDVGLADDRRGNGP